jgi:hypothetical protein
MPKYKSESRAHRRKDAPYEDRQQASRGGGDEEHGGRRGRAHKQDDTAPCPTFDAMNLKPDLLKGVYAYGFEKPSAIQQRAIRPIVRGRDVIAQSQSGTGKTAVFSISALQLLDETSRETQVLVLSPTRELAEQTQRVMQVSSRTLTSGMDGLLFYGAFSYTFCSRTYTYLQSLGDFMNVRVCKIDFSMDDYERRLSLVLTFYYFSSLCF